MMNVREYMLNGIIGYSGKEAEVGKRPDGEGGV